MTRYEFYEYVAANVNAELTGIGNNPDMIAELCDIKKLGVSYKGLTMRGNGTCTSAVINLDSAWREYVLGGSLEKIAKEITEKLRDFKLDTNLFADATDYNAVKDKLFIRLNGVENNAEVLNEVPYKKVCDLALTCHIFIGEKDGHTMSAIVNRSLLDGWGITEEQLFEDAVNSAENMYPVKIETLGGVIAEFGLTDPEKDDAAGENIYVITNKSNMYGAALLVDNDVLDRVGKLIGGDFYILPSSIHELLVMKDDGFADPEGLARMVFEINRSTVAPEERLSDHVYHYSMETKELRIAA